MRANHADRFVVLLMDAAGGPAAVAKVALSEAGELALQREAAALEEVRHRLQAPVSAPRVLACRPGVLVTTAVPWRIRRYPWFLPASVAAALGSLFRATRIGEVDPVGGCHGDCAPWNLLWTRAGWVLIDWESASDEAPPFTDVFHFLVQAHALLKRPRRAMILAGLDGRGWVGHVIGVYSEAAAVSPRGVRAYFGQYLVESMATLDPDTHDGLAGSRARRQLLDALSGFSGR
jgi:hypothetical protein